MGYMGRKSQLRSDIIKKVWFNKKNYKYQDFEFKIDLHHNEISFHKGTNFEISVYNFGNLILKLKGLEAEITRKERFVFEVTYFNPQTDNDCYSINHIIAVCVEHTLARHQNKDMGNVDVLNNKFIFRKRESYYSHTKMWEKGEIKEHNYSKLLSYEFATDEYINYIKKIFEIKKIQRRTIKKEFKNYVDKIVLLEELRKK